MMDDLYLFARIADTAIAIPTADLEAVVRLGEIVRIARTPAYVRGLAALRSRVLTVIDVRARLTGEVTALTAAPMAIVAEVEGHNYALLIDDVRDISKVDEQLASVRGRINPSWRPFARGMVMQEGTLHLVLSIQDIVRVQQVAAAA